MNEREEILSRPNLNITSKPSTTSDAMWLISSKTAKAEHYNNLIHDKKNDYREVYNTVNSLLFRKEQSPLPQAENDYVLAEQFSEYFKDKIDTIMLQLQSTEAGQLNPEYIRITI